MLMPLAGSRNIYRCLSSASGSFWRAAIRSSPESAERVAKSEVDFDLRKSHTTARTAKSKGTSIFQKNHTEGRMR
jgi:hypothetical protein